MSSHLRLGLPKGLFPVGETVKILKGHVPSTILATRPAYLNHLVLITLTMLGERYKPWSSSSWSLLHSPFALILGPNIRLWILFSNTLSLFSSYNVRDLVSQSYWQRYCFIYILIFKFEERSREEVFVLNNIRFLI